MIRIVTDTTSGLPPYMAKQYNSPIVTHAGPSVFAAGFIVAEDS